MLGLALGTDHNLWYVIGRYLLPSDEEQIYLGDLRSTEKGVREKVSISRASITILFNFVFYG